MRFFLIVVLLLVLAAGVALGRAGRSFFTVDVGLPSKSGASAQPTPARTPDAAPKAKPERARGEAVVEIGEAQLAGELNARMAGKPLGTTPLGAASADRFTVSLRGGKVEVGGEGRVGPARVPFTIVGEVAPDGGRPTVRVSDARVSGVPLPEPARRQIEQALQGEVDRQLAGRPVTVRSVEIGGGQMRIIGAPAG
jgi:hypothetical protein